MHRLIQERIKEQLEIENHLIETDLVEAVKRHGIGIDVIYQQRPDHTGSEYRGLRLDGKWLIDHHPEWGEVRD